MKRRKKRSDPAVRRTLSLIAAGLMASSMVACTSEQNEELNKALDNLGSALSDAEESLSGAAEKAKDAVNYAGESLGINGEYSDTMTMLKAYGDKFKSQVEDKLEEMNCGEYIETLNASIDSMKNLKSDLASAWQETQLADTESYKFFSDFDPNKYDITFTVYTNNDTFNRCRVVKDSTDGNLDAYSSMYIFDKAEAEKSDSVFDLIGLLYSTSQDNVWYDCNQVTKTKTVAKQASEYKAIETILNGYTQGTFQSSTLNNLISHSGVSVDKFVLNGAEVQYVFKDGKLIGAIYVLGDKIDYAYITVNDFDAKSQKLVNGAEKYKLQD